MVESSDQGFWNGSGRGNVSNDRGDGILNARRSIDWPTTTELQGITAGIKEQTRAIQTQAPPSSRSNINQHPRQLPTVRHCNNLATSRCKRAGDIAQV